MRFPGRIGVRASPPVYSKRRLAGAVAGWVPTQGWAANQAKTPTSVAEVPSSGVISTCGLEMLLEFGVVSTVWDTGLPLTPAGIWAVLRYALAVDVSAAGEMCLSSGADALRYHHRTAMSEYLGVAVAMQVVGTVLAARHSGAQARFVDAEFALFSGSYPGFTATLLHTLRPDYFVFVPSGPAYVLECKGSGSTANRTSVLAKAIRQLESVVHNGLPLPGLCTHVRLSNEGISCVILDPEGDEESNAPAAHDFGGLASLTVTDDADGRVTVSDVAALRAELELISSAALLEWSGAPGSADRLIPPRVAALRDRPSREDEADASRVRLGGLESVGIEETYPFAGRSLQVFRGIDASLREALAERAQSDDPFRSTLDRSDRYDANLREQFTGVNDQEAVAVSGDGAVIRLRLR